MALSGMTDADADLSELNLLEWSQDLNRALLRLPFRPLRSSVDDQDQACFLYKLAYSSSRKEIGLLLLDPDAGNAFYEGVSLRTLDRRTQFSQAEASRSNRPDNALHLTRIISAIHHALDPRTLLDKALKTIVGLESTRFSSSLSINVKSKDDAIHRSFKTSFDLDPLDHASLANMISTHFVRPLLHLAHIFAQSASPQQLDAVRQLRAPQAQRADSTISSDSLELLRRSALAQARLPLGPLHPLSTRGHMVTKAMPSDTTDATLPSNATAHLDFDVDNDSDSDSDMLFFGPPGLKAPTRKSAVQGTSQSNTTQPRPLSSPTLCLSSDSEDGDRTLTAPLAATSDSHTVNPEHNPSSNSVQTKCTVLAASRDDSSDTSEEESLPVAGSGDHVKQPSSSPLHRQARESPKREQSGSIPPSATQERDANKSPEITPPPPSFLPPSSQISPSSRNIERGEQQRRREQIARIKRGSTVSQVSDHPSNCPARPAAPTRKRARF